MTIFQLAPGALPYTHPLLVTLLSVSGVLLICASVVRFVRPKLSGSMRTISKSWGPILSVFGVIGIVLAVSRAEGISFLSMPFLALLWATIFVIILVLHVVLYRKRAYTILPTERVEDPREKYLPKPKRR